MAQLISHGGGYATCFGNAVHRPSADPSCSGQGVHRHCPAPVSEPSRGISDGPQGPNNVVIGEHHHYLSALSMRVVLVVLVCGVSSTRHAHRHKYCLTDATPGVSSTSA